MPITLPSDALDQIVNHIDDYSDILNAALSTKALYSVAVPQHLHYRDLRTRLHNPALWAWLSRSDDLRAAHIRSLTILPDRDYDFYAIRPSHTYDLRERLPPELTPDEPRPFTSYRNLDECRESETSLITALRRMSSLHRFRWYCVPRPLLEEGTDNIWRTLQRLGTVKELDIFDGDANEITLISITVSDSFLCFSAFTSLKLRTSAWSQSDNPEIPHQLEQMLLTNCPYLEILVLELDLDEQINGTANIDRLLTEARWTQLRILRLRGVNCKVSALTRFLIAHPGLQELALAQMMPGHAWTRLYLPNDALPNLRHLECSSAQAAALLRNSGSSSRPLETLLGIELHDSIVDSKYFSWDDEWEEEDHEDANEDVPSPWKALLLDGLKAQNSITRLGLVSVGAPNEIETLSVVAPHVKDIDIGDAEDIPKPEWQRLLSLFPALEVIRGANLVWFDPSTDELPSEAVEKANVQIQALAPLCPKLRLILVGFHAKKAIIIRGVGHSNVGVRWVVRNWAESEETYVKDGERVYGP